MAKWIDLNDARRALQVSRGANVRIAVLDSGVDPTHPHLQGRTLSEDLVIAAEGPQVLVGPGNQTDTFGHGTAVAAVIWELAPDSEIGSFRVLGTDNTSRTIVIRRAAEEAIARGYQIVNCSFGCSVESQVLDYKNWVDACYLKGIHVVAACDNLDFRRTQWPAFFPSVISVNMAKSESNTLFYFQHGTLIEFAAKGVNVRLPWLHGECKQVTGSSFAAPRLTGMLARLLGAFPELMPLQAKAILQQLAIPLIKEIAAGNVV